MKEGMMQKTFLFFGFFIFLIFGASTTNAAALYLSPSSGNFSVGDILTMSVLVNTQSQAINNSSAVINFPAGLLEVVSVSKSGSIFSLWVEEPAFSNSAGTVSFDGGLPTPGFNGTAGRLINIIFRAKSAGTASVIFSSGAVRANDGYGTDILQTKAQAKFNLISEERPVVLPLALGAPQAPNITSLTHSDSDKWYAVSDAKFTWDLPPGITGARLLIGKIPNAIPTVNYIPAINSKELPDLADGIWYFSVRLRNDAGWGAVSNFRFQIDTKPPEPFSIKFVDSNLTDNPRPTALFETTDSLSGIAYYKVKIGEGDFFPVSTETIKQNPYTLPIQAPGKRTILVQAYDKAGNYSTASEEFVIQSIDPPIITEYPKTLASGEILIIKGKSKYPDARVDIFLQHEKDEVKSYSVKSDQDGKFTFVAEDRLSSGIYTAWAEVTDERGARSEPSGKVTIAVERPALLRIGSWAVGFLSVVIPLIALILLLVYLSWHWWHKFATMRKRVKKEIREAEQAIHKAFDLLKEAIREQIKMLEKTKSKRELTEEEEKIVKQLKKDLDDAEKFVRKEIEDIEKEVK